MDFRTSSRGAVPDSYPAFEGDSSGYKHFGDIGGSQCADDTLYNLATGRDAIQDVVNKLSVAAGIFTSNRSQGFTRLTTVKLIRAIADVFFEKLCDVRG